MPEDYSSESLLDLAALLGQQTDIQEIFRIVSLQVSSLLQAEMASIILINPSTQNTVKTVMKEVRDVAQKGYQRAQTQVVGWTSKHDRAFLSQDLQSDKRFTSGLLKATGVGAAMCVSIKCEGQTIGFLLAFRNDGEPGYDDVSLQWLEKLAAITAPFLSNAQKIERYFQPKLPEASLLAKYKPLGLLGESKSFTALLQAIEAAARCDVRVLLEGESGTGKELVARAIHCLSSRREQQFVAIDCGAIPEHLIESELFGYMKGAFTGATQNRKGLVEQAHNGTLFMDEIGNLPFEMQAKLLRVLQEGEVRPVGSNDSIKVDVRVIAACSASLRTLVEAQAFRQDLFYRLHVYPIQIPTLNERRKDISLLADHFLQRFAEQQKKRVKSIQAVLVKFLQWRDWTGNIRELENFIERLVTIAKPGAHTLTAEILPVDLQNEYLEFLQSGGVRSGKSLKQQLQESEYQIILQTLQDYNWNQSKAALALDTTEQLIRYRMKKLGISRPQ